MTKAGCTTPARLGYMVPPPEDKKQSFPLDLLKTITAATITRNMHLICSELVVAPAVITAPARMKKNSLQNKQT